MTSMLLFIRKKRFGPEGVGEPVNHACFPLFPLNEKPQPGEETFIIHKLIVIVFFYNASGRARGRRLH